MPSHSHRVTFGNIKFRLPIGFPKRKTVKIFLQNKTVLQRMNIPIQNTIVRERQIEDLILSGKSLMKIKKRIGPKTDPWGTPAGSEA